MKKCTLLPKSTSRLHCIQYVKGPKETFGLDLKKGNVLCALPVSEWIFFRFPNSPKHECLGQLETLNCPEVSSDGPVTCQGQIPCLHPVSSRDRLQHTHQSQTMQWFLLENPVKKKQNICSLRDQKHRSFPIHHQTQQLFHAYLFCKGCLIYCSGFAAVWPSVGWSSVSAVF